MCCIRSFYVLTALLLISYGHAGYAAEDVSPKKLIRGGFKHHARDIKATIPTLTADSTVPGVAPAAITSESQIITSFYALYTLCPLTSIFSLSSSGFSTKASSYHSRTVNTRTSPYRSETTALLGRSESGSCTTIYSTGISVYCRTTLTGLYTQLTVTDCSQYVTFSTDHGYSLTYSTPTAISLSTPTSGSAATTSATITLAPTIQTLTTNYLAYWADLTAGTAPSQVTLEICSSNEYNSRACIFDTEVWDATTITKTETFRTEVDLLTTINGPSELIVGSYTTDILKDRTTLRLAAEITSVQTFYVTSTSSRIAGPPTESSAALPVSTSTGPTIYKTMMVENVTPFPTQSLTITSGLQFSTLSTQTSSAPETITTKPTVVAAPQPKFKYPVSDLTSIEDYTTTTTIWTTSTTHVSSTTLVYISPKASLPLREGIPA